jgi:hypothetical protein
MYHSHLLCVTPVTPVPQVHMCGPPPPHHAALRPEAEAGPRGRVEAAGARAVGSLRAALRLGQAAAAPLVVRPWWTRVWA